MTSSSFRMKWFVVEMGHLEWKLCILVKRGQESPCLEFLEDFEDFVGDGLGGL